jgi:flagellar protein FliO/FliZ
MSALSGLFENRALMFAAAAVAFLVAAVLILLVFRLAFGRKLRMPGGRARQPRLGIVDAFDLDGQRQLVLVRRDNVEHLIMIGKHTDILVESEIVRADARDIRETRGREKDAREPTQLPQVVPAKPPAPGLAPPGPALAPPQAEQKSPPAIPPGDVAAMTLVEERPQPQARIPPISPVPAPAPPQIARTQVFPQQPPPRRPPVPPSSVTKPTPANAQVPASNGTEPKVEQPKPAGPPTPPYAPAPVSPAPVAPTPRQPPLGAPSFQRQPQRPAQAEPNARQPIPPGFPPLQQPAAPPLPPIQGPRPVSPVPGQGTDSTMGPPQPGPPVPPPDMLESLEEEMAKLLGRGSSKPDI